MHWNNENFKSDDYNYNTYFCVLRQGTFQKYVSRFAMSNELYSYMVLEKLEEFTHIYLNLE